MRKRLVSILKCPNNHQPDFKIFAAEADREGTRLNNLTHDQLNDSDEIIQGLLICESSSTAYPISNCIAILLSDNDIDIKHHQPLLEQYVDKCPDPYQSVLIKTLERFKKFKETSDGKWNREEMRYYDNEVNTETQRDTMLAEIKKVPIWRIFIPRYNHIVKFISDDCRKKNVLEIGCGNSRTVSWVFKPSEFDYNYIGTDISFKRLMVAQAAVPEGNFIQASALNLPFVNNCFEVIISFGMLHHLPRPSDAITNCAPLVANGGYFVFHEPIQKPEINVPGIETFRKVMSDYEHSAHDGKINLDEMLSTFSKYNFSSLHIIKEISIVRAFSETLLKKISRGSLKRKSVIQAITAADKLVLSTIGKISKRAGASAVFAVMKKNK